MGIRGKLVALTVGIAVLAAVLFDAYLADTLSTELALQTEEDLSARAALATRSAARAGDLGAEAPGLAVELAAAAGGRVTIVDPSGRVRGDSSVPADRLGDLENHAARPEIIEARRAGTGLFERVSGTVRMRMLYAAVRLDRPDGPWFVRVAFAPVAIDRALSAARRRLVEGTLLALGAAIAAALVGSRAIARRIVHLTATARAMQGDLGRRARVAGDDEVAALGGALDELAGSLERTLAELGGERDRFGAVLEAMREGVLVTDAEGDIALVNPALSELLDVGSCAVGRPPLEVLRSAGLHELLAEVARARAAAAREMELSARGGAPRRLVVHAAPLHVRGPRAGEPGSAPEASRARGGVVAVFFDVTELRRLEQLRRDFVVNASHELRTPVASIHASSETLLGGALCDPEAARDFVEVIDRNAARLRRLVEELLDLSRIEAGARPLAPATLDAAAQAEAVAALLRARAEARRTSLAVDVPAGTLVEADAVALEQVLTNLVENAIVHTPEGSRVVLRGRAAERRVVLEVEDDGPGVPAQHQARIFERFYRVDPGRSRASGGTGLGLSIVRHLVEAMRGEIALVSGPRGGALFRITLPAPDSRSGAGLQRSTPIPSDPDQSAPPASSLG
ncbi:MAG: HAMP domain-containing protein [Polyangiaceae bacterium]|nr:HAMP domain-containing protein [Polyangiaceae bacterium]